MEGQESLKEGEAQRTNHAVPIRAERKPYRRAFQEEEGIKAAIDELRLDEIRGFGSSIKE